MPRDLALVFVLVALGAVAGAMLGLGVALTWTEFSGAVAALGRADGTIAAYAALGSALGGAVGVVLDPLS